jgi:hypothetical protein
MERFLDWLAYSRWSLVPALVTLIGWPLLILLVLAEWAR